MFNCKEICRRICAKSSSIVSSLNVLVWHSKVSIPRRLITPCTNCRCAKLAASWHDPYTGNSLQAAAKVVGPLAFVGRVGCACTTCCWTRWQLFSRKWSAEIVCQTWLVLGHSGSTGLRGRWGGPRPPRVGSFYTRSAAAAALQQRTNTL